MSICQDIKDIEFVDLHDRFTLSQGKGINAYSEGDCQDCLTAQNSSGIVDNPKHERRETNSL